jgi:hypothetical protein
MWNSVHSRSSLFLYVPDSLRHFEFLQLHVFAGADPEATACSAAAVTDAAVCFRGDEWLIVQGEERVNKKGKAAELTAQKAAMSDEQEGNKPMQHNLIRFSHISGFISHARNAASSFSWFESQSLNSKKLCTCEFESLQFISIASLAAK